MSPPPEDPTSNLDRQISEIINAAKEQVEAAFGEFTSAVGKTWGKAGELLDTPAVALGADPSLGPVNASSQSLYWSQQFGKFDVSAVTASFDGLKVDESGISFMGAKVYEFPWVSKLENKFGTASASAKELKALEERVASAEQTLSEDSLRTAATRNREIYGYKEESERSLRRIKEIHRDARAFAGDVEHRTNAAKDELLRVVQVINEAIGSS
ncbi:hypothetical protein ABZ464_06115 [Streptomyces sp. NPDC005820]|uniref:hypothetical protein n=1 Tax=Streptomyces sp. NPDC005820 TaxID=3157069 RepID=UPI0033D5030B